MEGASLGDTEGMAVGERDGLVVVGHRLGPTLG